MNIKTIGLYTLISIFCLINSSIAASLLSGMVLTENDEGVVIVDVKFKTAIRQAGIERGDIIQEIEGEQISTLDNYFIISKKVNEQDNDQINIVLKRDYSVLTKTIKRYVPERKEINKASNNLVNKNYDAGVDDKDINAVFPDISKTPEEHLESIAQDLIKHINSQPNFDFPQRFSIPASMLNKLETMPFNLSYSSEINAGTDSNTIVVTTGMMNIINKDSELALVLAHEMSHVIRGHKIKRTVGAYTAQALSTASNIIIPGLGSIAGYGGNLALLAYDRAQEREADTIGLQIINNAGYDLSEAIKLYSRFDHNNPDCKSFLSTHPCSVERLANLRQLTSKIEYSQGIQKK